jgi:hypothetical protein
VFFYRVLLSGLVPYQDNEGLYDDLANPGWDAGHRTSIVKKSNKRQMVKQMRWNKMVENGIAEVDYSINSASELQAGVTRYNVSI